MKIPVVANLRRTLRHAEFIDVCAFRLILGSNVATFISGVFVTSFELAKPTSSDSRSREFLFAFELLGNQGR